MSFSCIYILFKEDEAISVKKKKKIFLSKSNKKLKKSWISKFGFLIKPPIYLYTLRGIFVILTKYFFGIYQF